MARQSNRFISDGCRICGDAWPPGCTVTCGRSLCQEADYFDNAARNARKGSARRALLIKDAQEKAELAARVSRKQQSREVSQ